MIKKIILKKATRAIINRGKLRKFVARGGKIKQLPAQKSTHLYLKILKLKQLKLNLLKSLERIQALVQVEV